MEIWARCSSRGTGKCKDSEIKIGWWGWSPPNEDKGRIRKVADQVLLQIVVKQRLQVQTKELRYLSKIKMIYWIY